MKSNISFLVKLMCKILSNDYKFVNFKSTLEIVTKLNFE